MMYDTDDIEVLDYEEDTPVTNIKPKKKNYILVIFLLVFVVISVLIIKYFFDDFSSKNYDFKGIEYKIVDFNADNYIFKTLKYPAIFDSIIMQDIVNNKEVNYSSSIEDGKVIINNGTNSYKIKTINNAKKLIIGMLQDTREYSTIFVLTNNGILYSISLYDNKLNMVYDVEKLEQNIKLYKLDEPINDIALGNYEDKNNLSSNLSLLITNNNGKKYILKRP